jgi:hypothetical protein
MGSRAKFGLFSYAERAEDLAEQVLGCMLAGDGAEILPGVAEVLSGQFKRGIAPKMG